MLRVTGLSKKNDQGSYFFKDVEIVVNHDEKIALLSKDSSAITAFYEVLSGKSQADSGTIEWGQTITYDYLPNENHEFFSAEQDIELMDWLRQYSEEKDEQFIRSFLGRMLFSGEEVFKKSGVLSGGEKVRCMLSKIMLKNPNFLLLDEPTNHLDLESITALNNALTEFPGNLVMTSHDHQLLDTVCNRIIEITPNGMIDTLTNFDEYIRSEKFQNQRAELYDGVIA